MTGRTCVRAAVFEFIFELKAGGFFCFVFLYIYFARWILTASYMAEKVIHCDSPPKIYTAFCSVPPNKV